MTTSATVNRVTIPTRGPFSLEELALFGFGHRNERSFDGVMRMAFRVDHDLETAVGVEVRQRGDQLDLTVHGDADPDVVAAQVARVISCDHDGEGFAAARPPRPGHRRSPAGCARPSPRAVLLALRGRRLVGHLSPPSPRAGHHPARAPQRGPRHRLRAGRPDRHRPARPVEARGAHRPARAPGRPHPRLQAVAAAAQRGDLDVDRLVALGPEAAQQAVQELPGIGPFYSALIVVRACGFVDVLPTRRGPQPAGGPRPLRPVHPDDRRGVCGVRRPLEALPHLGGRPHPGRRPPARRRSRQTTAVMPPST